MKNCLLLFILPLFFLGCSKDEAVNGQKVSSIKFKIDGMSVIVGDEFTLIIDHNPAKSAVPAYRWRSSDSAVLNVSPTGDIIALTVGTAVISAVTSDGLKTESKIIVYPVK
ncbi:Ig-like domain-containing protein [Pedobacter hartonius]|nr:Ig-like domain-containing protein [Pedobacter hartonius]